MATHQKLGEKVMKILNKGYNPNEMIAARVGKHDLQFRTDGTGMPVLLFIGKETEKGTIKEERFARQIKTVKDGSMKVRWENKGKAS